ncbi:MAG: sulfotransferase family 2 domain-containing protein [Candidatus Lokiarchaeota archaeon]|nr:sulfotransferase family 2 domain-containing protein [Candidatus Lokiarchaeota archaeon]
MEKVGFVHIPKCAGRSLNNTLKVDTNFINFGHHALYATHILCKHKTSKYATNTVWSPKEAIENNEFLIRQESMNPARFNDTNWPSSTFDWAYLTGFYEDALKLGIHKQDNDKELDYLRVFSSIRNPFDQLRSYWRHDQPFGWFSCNVIHNIKNFEHFINMYCDNEVVWHWPEFGQNPFFQICKRGEYKTFIPKENLIRWENLEEEVERVAEIMGLKNIDMKQIESFKSRPFPNKKMDDDFTTYTKDMVLKLRKKLDPVLNEFEYDY